MNYSVLMSVYYKEKPEYLRQSMNSMFEQSVPTDDFVLVCDGPLNAELDAVIDDMLQKYPETLHVFRLEKNSGLGNALNYGITQCKNDIVARMDSDDIARSDRCERQLAVFAHNPDISVCSGFIEEFFDDPSDAFSVRRIPEHQKDIIEFAKKRTPFNHACSMYRKQDVLDAGGYKDFFLVEDYYLWIRILLMNKKGYNLQDNLLWVRTGRDMYIRRGGWKYAKSQVKLFWFMYSSGFISLPSFVNSTIVRTISTMAPSSIRKKMYELVLRMRVDPEKMQAKK